MRDDGERRLTICEDVKIEIGDNVVASCGERDNREWVTMLRLVASKVRERLK